MAVAVAHVCVWGSGFSGGGGCRPDCKTQLQWFVSATRKEVEDVSARKAATALGQWQRGKQPAKLSNNHIKAQQAVVQGDESEICVLKKKYCELCITSSVCSEPVIFNVNAFEVYKGWTKKVARKGSQSRDLSSATSHVSKISWTWSLQNRTGSVTEGFQLLLMLFSGEGEHGPTDCSHSLLLQHCSSLHQSCTQAFTSIFTWELSESRIWSTIIPAQKMWASEKKE